MKKLIFILILSFHGIIHAAAPVCKNCDKAQDLILEITQKRIACEPLNLETYDLQKSFVTRGTGNISRLLIESSFSAAHADQVWLLAAKVAPYDIESFLIQDIGRGQFRQNKVHLMESLNRLVKTQQISEVLKLQLLEYVGMIPSKNRLKDINCEFSK